MLRIDFIAGLAALLVAGPGDAQSPPVPQIASAPVTPTAPPPHPGEPPNPPVPDTARAPAAAPARQIPSLLDGIPEADRQALIKAEIETYTFQVQKDRSAALKAWCETGYADPLLCARAPELQKDAPKPAPEAAPAQEPARAHARGRVAVARITGFGAELSAELIDAAGDRIMVVPPRGGAPGTRLADGSEVTAIFPGEVRLLKNHQPLSLRFAGTGEAH